MYRFVSVKTVAAFFAVSLISLPVWADTQILYRFELMWPTIQQPWYFNSPYDVAFDDENYIYVADGFNGRIKKFSSSGYFVTDWALPAVASPETNPLPVSVAASPLGPVFVLDLAYQRVIRYSRTGDYEKEWGTGVINLAEGLACDNVGNVHVADTGNNRVLVYDADGTLLKTWTAGGSLLAPCDIAVSTSGKVYVADGGHHQVVVLDSEGNVLSAWGGHGSADGQFLQISGIGLDNDGNLLVTDAQRSDVQVFTGDGVFISKFGSAGSEVGQFACPDGVAISQTGRVYVADREENDRIQVFTPGGIVQQEWTSQLRGVNEFNNPVCLGLDPQGNLYVVESGFEGYGNMRIQKLDPNGAFLGFWGPGEGVPGHVTEPYEMAFAPDGRAFVVNAADDSIHEFGPDGAFKRQLGNGLFISEPHICVDKDGYLYATGIDYPNSLKVKIVKFDKTDGSTQVWTYGNDTEIYVPFGMAAGQGNETTPFIYIAEQQTRRILKFNNNGEFLGSWGSQGSGRGEFEKPTGLCIDSGGDVYVADEDLHRIQRFTADGEYVAGFGAFGATPGQMNRPMDIAVTDKGHLYVADYINNRVQMFRPVTQAGTSKAIIVAGGGPYEGNTLWSATELCANFAWRSLIYRGYSKNEVRYLSHDTQIDLDGNGEPDDILGAPSNQLLGDTLTSAWAGEADAIYVYMVDHGGNSSFRIGPAETFTARELDGWLDQLQSGEKPVAVTVIIDACQSGSFIESLDAPDGAVRRIIASTPADQPAYFLSTGDISFSHFFWSEVFNGQSIGAAFSTTQDVLRESIRSQNPMADSNGDHVANTLEDIETLSQVFMSSSARLWSGTPGISSSVVIGEDGLITAADIAPSDNISQVWAVIQPPSSGVAPGGTENAVTPISGLPTLELWPSPTPDTPGRYAGRYMGFHAPGTYHISVYARDRQQIVSAPKVATFTKTSGTGDRRAIIVAASVPEDAAWNRTVQAATLAYDALRFQGYDAEDVKFFCNETVYPGINGKATLLNIQEALTTWMTIAKEAAPLQDLVIYFAGNGNGNELRLDKGGEVLRSDVLSEWLDIAQTSVSGPLIVIFDSCGSGSFLHELKPVDDSRVLITSMGATAAPAEAIDNRNTFSQFFWRQVYNGADLRRAFQFAANAVSLGDVRLKPMLDDNGDGIYEPRKDGKLASETTLGLGFVLASDYPVLTSVTPYQELAGTKNASAPTMGIEAALWIGGIISTRPVKSAWAVVTPPGRPDSVCGEKSLSETIVPLTLVTGQRYEGSWAGFVEHGDYLVRFYAMDTEGNVSPTLESTVRQTGEYSTPDAYEPDDTCGATQWIGVNGPSLYHNFHSASDEDWTRFYVENGKLVTIETNDLGPNADTVLQVFAEGDTQSIAFDDNGSINGDGRASLIHFRAPADGIYCIRVSNAIPEDYGPEAYYTLSVLYEAGVDIVPGSIACVVTSAATGNPVSGATIDLGFGSLSARTKASGTCVFVALPPRTYTLQASAPGYENATQSKVLLSGDTASLSFTLAPAQQPAEGESPPEGESVEGEDSVEGEPSRDGEVSADGEQTSEGEPEGAIPVSSRGCAWLVRS